MFGGSKKPYSAVTVQIDRLTSEQYEEDDVSGIIDLVEVIRIQESGPTEAARAIRKKLKYGSPHRQIRALVILDGLIQNAGSRFQRTFADEPLLERLRLMAREETVEPEVRQKCQVLFRQWANAYKDIQGLTQIANLYKELPKTQRPAAAKQKVLRESEPTAHDEEEWPHFDRSTSSPTSAAPSRPPAPQTPTISSKPVTLTPTSSGFSKNLLGKGLFGSSSSSSKGGFNLAKEKDNMTNCIARASIASTNLINGLQLVNREKERVSDNQEIRNRFETCKKLRKQILLYIQYVESDEWIGSLVNANDELVKALTAYEIMDRSIEDDSDSDLDVESSIPPHARQHISSDTQAQLEGLSLAEKRQAAAAGSPPAKPPRPAPAKMAMPARPAYQPPKDDEGEEEDEDDPFGDSNAAPTPQGERSGMSWREV